MLVIRRKSLQIPAKSMTQINIKRFLTGTLFVNAFIFLYIELLKCYNSSLAAVINLIPDLLNILAICLIILERKKTLSVARQLSFLFAVFCLLWMTISGLYAEGSIPMKYQRYRYILIGFNTYFICTKYVTKAWWEHFKSFLFGTQIVHVFLSTLQYILLHPGVDRTNGIFGFMGYNNAVNGVFCLSMAMIGMEEYLKNEKGRIRAVSMVFLSCYVCAIAEIKAFFVIYLIGAILILFFNGRNITTLKRTLYLAMISIAGMVLALLLLYHIMPQNMYALANLSQWIAYERWETGRAGGMGRVTQLQWIYDNVYHGEFVMALLGKGLGADISAAAYELGKLFWNFGGIGLALFLLFLIAKAVEMFKIRKKSQEAMISMVMCILTIPCMGVWNATLNRTAMFLFIFLAIGSAEFQKEINTAKEGRGHINE